MPPGGDYRQDRLPVAVRKRDKRLLADKAYSHNSTRADLRKRRITHTIPERSNQISYRKSKGSAGGRPPAFDAQLYCHRNTVERGFNRLKQWRGVATRYEVRPDLPRRHHPGRHRHPPPRPQLADTL